ncbi:MAG TPA: replication factor C large subunit, partial [Thermoplasmataceae archaeon]|nr:replication factor C large subunit [Thermoplasmataceae archaeon]
HGPPGVGKTTTALALADYLQVPIIEMNASDERNADAMKRVALMGATYMDLLSSDKNRAVQRIILVDEADNIFESRSASRGGDYGGLSELLRVIRSARNPIVLTMNDFYSFRRKSSGREIVESSEVIELRQFRRRGDHDYKSFKEKMSGIIEETAQYLGMKFNQAMIDFLIEKNRDDIRAIINDAVSLMSSRSGTDSASVGDRDNPLDIFTIMRKTFKESNYSELLLDLLNTDFETEDYLMWIDENLSLEAQDPEDLAAAYELVSFSDLLLGSVIKKQHYAFKGYAQEILAGTPLSIAKRNPHFVKYQFPAFIMKMSRMRESREQRRSLLWKLGRMTHSPSQIVAENLWYFRLLMKSQPSKSFVDRMDFSPKEMELLKRS